MGQHPIPSIDLWIEKFEERITNGRRSPTSLTTTGRPSRTIAWAKLKALSPKTCASITQDVCMGRRVHDPSAVNVLGQEFRISTLVRSASRR